MPSLTPTSKPPSNERSSDRRRMTLEALALPVGAVAAGFISFSSPCVLPLLPGYLSYMSSVSATDDTGTVRRGLRVRAAMVFVAGFTLVFVILGATTSALGSLMLRNQMAVTRCFGVVIIVLGLSTAGLLRIPMLMRERRADLSRVPRGPAGAFPFGMAFAAGWAPCIGPILATILTTASVAGTAWWGMILLALYSAGLGIPFVLLAVGISRLERSVAFLRRHAVAIERCGGVLLVTVGVLFVTGRWQTMFRPLQSWFADLGWPPI